MIKQVWTYTKLAERAMRMAAKDPEEFEKLKHHLGSDKLVPGAFVYWRMGARSARFDIKVARVNRVKVARGTVGTKITRWLLASVVGNKRDGRMYSSYTIHLHPKHYRKGEVDRLLPISLPDGVTCDDHTTCHVHRVDGTMLPLLAVWQGGGRGNDGRVITRSCGAKPLYLVYDDAAGDLVETSILSQLQLYSQYQNSYYDLHWHPEKSETRRGWINSILSIPGIDKRATLESALRACKVATELTAENPAIGMMLLPARPLGTHARFVPDGSTDDAARVGKFTETNEGCFYSSTESFWYLPKVIVYWLDYRAPADHESHWTTIAMTIPPHGHEGLNPEGKVSPLCSGYPYGAKVGANYDLVCWKLGSAMANNRAMCHPMPGNTLYGQEHPYAQRILKDVIFWPDSLDKVHVCCTSNADKPVLPHGHLYGATPEEVKNLIDGKFVLESLPML